MLKKLLFVLLVLSLLVTNVAFSKKLIVYSSVDEANARKILSAFTKDTGIDVDFVFLSSGPALARIEAEKQNPQADVWFGAPMENHIIAKERGLTQPFKITVPKEISTRFYDKEGYYYPIYMNPLGIGVNMTMLEKLKLPLPQSWNDLLKSVYKKTIQYPNPQSSGTGYTFVTGLIKILGEDAAMKFLKLMAPNVQTYTQSGTAPSKAVAIGEAVFGIQFTPAFFQFMDQGYNVKIVFPKEGVPYEVACMSIIKGAKNIEEAQKLVEWVISKKGQQEIINQKTYFYPIRTDVDFGNLPSLSSIKLIHVDPKWAADNKTRIVNRWINEVLPY
ncbi:MAG: ABC transporter substrate-binding protein [Fervidobacterium pennivorans]|uniref:ABC transporter substrate-binding protein n=1 Tax=Fervidobacterium islandicum TaxID=2423 RepID=A0AAI8GDT9_FERIS|nr:MULTISPECIES: ABC transporter substrate-binding protein [Fervidobacterium]AMW33623.2 ABC transporter substrate-binding protein [Fervidobacterium islandicum]SDH67482.1 iron(III) transport system substrate-binding protein [Fervidobacterium changbaicum]